MTEPEEQFHPLADNTSVTTCSSNDANHVLNAPSSNTSVCERQDDGSVGAIESTSLSYTAVDGRFSVSTVTTVDADRSGSLGENHENDSKAGAGLIANIWSKQSSCNFMDRLMAGGDEDNNRPNNRWVSAVNILFSKVVVFSERAS